MKRFLPVLLIAFSCASTSTSSSLKKMYAESLEERRSDGPLVTLERDYQEEQEERRAQVRQYFVDQELKTAQDYLYAGSLLVTSPLGDDLIAAEASGFKAAELGDKRGWRLAAEAIDRLLMLAGKPQRYGTQIEYIEVLQQCRLYPVDPRTSDKERESMGVEPLAELRARAAVAHERLQ